MTDLQVFNFDSQSIRTMIDAAGEPWWIASDVCAILGIVKTSSSVALLDPDEKGAHTVGTPGGPQQVLTVNESGLYALIFKSRRPEAKRFRKWITAEVLPAIRKTGGYEAPAAPGKDPLLAQIEALADVRRCQLEHEARLAKVEHDATAVQAIAAAAETKADAALAGARGDTGFMTLLGFCRVHKLDLTRAEMARAGLELRHACIRAEIPLRSVPHETYGQVRLWPVVLLEEWAGYASAT